jgi:hypothetical protein
MTSASINSSDRERRDRIDAAVVRVHFWIGLMLVVFGSAVQGLAVLLNVPFEWRLLAFMTIMLPGGVFMFTAFGKRYLGLP